LEKPCKKGAEPEWVKSMTGRKKIESTRNKPDNRTKVSEQERLLVGKRDSRCPWSKTGGSNSKQLKLRRNEDGPRIEMSATSKEETNPIQVRPTTSKKESNKARACAGKRLSRCTKSKTNGSEPEHVKLLIGTAGPELAKFSTGTIESEQLKLRSNRRLSI